MPSKPKKSANQEQLDLHKCVQPKTIGAVVEQCVKHYAETFTNYSASETVSSLVGISYRDLRSIINDERPVKLSVFCSIARVCLYPKAFDDLKHLNFPESQPK